MPPYQYCFRPSGIVAARRAVCDLLDQGRELLVLDVKNAFGSVPHTQISKMLRTRSPGQKVVLYIERYLNARHSPDLEEHNKPNKGVGVPQGDPLSMFLFALAIQPVLEIIEEELGRVVAYADDVIIGLNEDVTAEQAIARAKEIYAQVGMEIQEAKCQTTEGDPQRLVYFLSQPYCKARRAHAAEDLLEKGKRRFQILAKYDAIPKIKKYVMLSRSVLPSVNYGPLCEVGDPEQAKITYDLLDIKILKAVENALGLSAYDMRSEELLQFVLASPWDGGLGTIMPGEYFRVMQEHARSVLDGYATEKLKFVYFGSHEYRDHCFRRPEKIPVQFVVPYADRFDDDELEALLAMRFGQPGYVPERCPVCGKPPGVHAPKCSGYMK